MALTPGEPHPGIYGLESDSGRASGYLSSERGDLARSEGEVKIEVVFRVMRSVSTRGGIDDEKNAPTEGWTGGLEV
jgi:hypothetical protein